MAIGRAFCMFCLLLAGLVLSAVVAPRYAWAEQIGGSGRFTHSAYSPEYGYKVFNCRASYLAQSSRMYDQYSGKYYKVVSDQGVIAYNYLKTGSTILRSETVLWNLWRPRCTVKTAQGTVRAMEVPFPMGRSIATSGQVVQCSC